MSNAYTLESETHLLPGTARAKELIGFLVEHGRLAIAYDHTLFWQAFMEGSELSPRLHQGDWGTYYAVAVACRDSGTLVGVSLAALDLSSVAENTVTVVHPAYRRQHIGAMLLKRKCELVAAQHVYLTASVSNRNEASMALCRSVMGEPVASGHSTFASPYRPEE